MIDYAREIAQQHKLQYGKQIDIELLVREISDIMQSYTRFGGVRPFAVSLIIGGIDKDGEPKLFSLDPSGIFYRYKAVVIGEGEDKITPILEERYKEMDLNEAIKFGIDVLKDYLGNNFAYERLILSYVKKGEKVKTLENHQIRELYEG